MLVVQNALPEGPGMLWRVLLRRGWKLDVRVMEGGRSLLPSSLKGYRALLILGGPMGAYEKERYPHLGEVERLIREGVEKALPVLGVCLGGQLIAQALGAVVQPSAAKEIGWYPVKLTEEGKRAPFLVGLPEWFPVFEWHGDTFLLPPGAELLIQGFFCGPQAFWYGRRTLALQFHPEVTPRIIHSWVRTSSEELRALGGKEVSRRIREETARIWPSYRKVFQRLLCNLAQFLEGS